MFKRSLRLLRFMDDLAEALILHVLLATPARRKFCAAALAVGTLLAYLFSGLAVAPPPLDPTAASQTYATPIASSWDNVGWEAVQRTADTGTVEPQNRELVEASIRANGDALTRARIHCASSDRFRFDVTPNYRTLRRVATLLIARGVLTAQQKAPDAARKQAGRRCGVRSYQPNCVEGGDQAIQDFFAARNLGLVAARGAGEGPYLIDAMIGLSIERQALKALTRLAKSGTLSVSQALWVCMEVRPARDTAARLADVLCNETQFARRIVRNYGATNRWPVTEDAFLLRLWLPWREQARKEAAVDLEAKLASLYSPVIRALENSGSLAEVQNLPESSVAPIGQVERVAGCFSGPLGVDLAARLVEQMVMPNVKAASARLATRDRETSELFELCQSIARRALPRVEDAKDIDELLR